MRRMPVLAMLPLILLAACQSSTQGGSQVNKSRPCSPRLAEANQCNDGSIYSFPELSNIR